MKPATSNTAGPCTTTDDIQPFGSREDAGRDLAKRLAGLTGRRDAIVLAFPGGGVPVGAEVAKALQIPFDILLVGKITTANCRDSSLGAITSGGVRTLNHAMIDRLHLSNDEINEAVLRKSLEIARRERFYRGHFPSHEVADHTVILVDDGSTPCGTIRHAIRLLRRQHADRIIVAVPAACQHAASDLRMETDDVVTLVEPNSRIPAGKYFKHFPRTSAKDVRRLLHRNDTEPVSMNRTGEACLS